ncbi:uncharacterized protein MICPUCDRAFT_902, partial [Micromonas pusilla CCMP1545]
RWPTSRVDEVHHARYKLRHVAIEIFLTDRRSVFLAFQDRRTMREAAARVAACKPGAVVMDRRRKLEAASRAQERWRRRELSTFDYLQALNTLAGRTKNDLTQYPVFPWILSDYTSPEIDLNDPKVFRDLTKPIGALHAPRLEQFIERFKLLAEDPDPSTPPFHYGSHYSSSGIVLFFLLRLEPFTGLNRKLQGGRFDHADRLFSSVDRCWRACLESTADVKELIPEFYCLPEFLENNSAHDLGSRQDGNAVGDVELPPWAKGSTHEFIRVMREALESETVSARVHEWIDLVFGSAQLGAEAVKRHNVFHHLTYEGAVDLDAIADADQRAAAEAQIINFGQTPARLFTKPHPRRHSPHAIRLASVVSPPLPGSGKLQRPHPERSLAPIAFLAVEGDASGALGTSRVVTMSADRVGSVGNDAGPSAGGADGGGSPAYAVVCDGGGDHRRIAPPFAAAADAGPRCFATIASNRVLLSCGHWDHGLRLIAVDDGRELQIATGHRDLVTCLATTAPGGATGGRAGSRDTTVAVWEVTPPPGGWGDPRSKPSLAKGGGLGHQPRRILFGHNDAVTCVAASAELDLVASGGADGAVLLHTLREGRHLRTVRAPRKKLQGDAGPGAADDHAGTPGCHGINAPCSAAPLATASASERLHAFAVTSDARFLLTGGEKGIVVVRMVHDLSIWAKYDGPGPGMTALCVTPEECIVGGMADGRIAVW